MHKIFVYGTLREGFRNHRLIRGAKFLGAYHTLKKYRMESYGTFPILHEDVPYAHIAGEVYEIDDDMLDRVDFLESEGYFYKRKKIKLKNFPDLVWCYFTIDYDEEFVKRDRNIKEKGKVQVWK